MSCSYGNYCFYQVVNNEICQHAYHTSSPNLVHRLYQIQHEVHNGIEGGMHKFCKECVDKNDNTKNRNGS